MTASRHRRPDYRSAICLDTEDRSQTHLAGLRVADGRDEGAELVAHGLCSNTGGSSLEVHVAGTANTGRVGVAARHEGGRHVEVDW